MAGVAILWSTFVLAVHMAGCTGYGGVLANQREAGLGMVKGSSLPPISIMARRAVRAHLTTMCIILCVAGIAIRWCTLVLTAWVTGSAINTDMFSSQRKGRF